MPPATSSKVLNYSDIAFWAITLIATDILIYGWMLPFMAVALTAVFTERFHFYPGVEIIFIVISVIGALAFAVNLKLESRFWKRFFAQEKPYMYILSIRECLNLGYLAYLIYDLIKIIESIAKDNGLKSIFLTEGTMFILYHNRFMAGSESDFIKENWRYCYTGIHEPKEQQEIITSSSIDKSEMTYVQVVLLWIESFWSYGCSGLVKKDPITPAAANETEKCLTFSRLIHAAQLSLTIAYITAAVGKIVYFSTLNAYARAMDIFVSMHRTTNIPVDFFNSTYSSEDSIAISDDDDSDSEDESDDENNDGNITTTKRVDKATSFSRPVVSSPPHIRPTPIRRKSQTNFNPMAPVHEVIQTIREREGAHTRIAPTTVVPGTRPIQEGTQTKTTPKTRKPGMEPTREAPQIKTPPRTTLPEARQIQDEGQVTTPPRTKIRPADLTPVGAQTKTPTMSTVPETGPIREGGQMTSPQRTQIRPADITRVQTKAPTMYIVLPETRPIRGEAQTRPPQRAPAPVVDLTRKGAPNRSPSRIPFPETDEAQEDGAQKRIPLRTSAPEGDLTRGAKTPSRSQVSERDPIREGAKTTSPPMTSGPEPNPTQEQTSIPSSRTRVPEKDETQDGPQKMTPSKTPIPENDPIREGAKTAIPPMTSIPQLGPIREETIPSSKTPVPEKDQTQDGTQKRIPSKTRVPVKNPVREGARSTSPPVNRFPPTNPPTRVGSQRSLIPTTVAPESAPNQARPKTASLPAQNIPTTPPPRQANRTREAAATQGFTIKKVAR